MVFSVTTAISHGLCFAAWAQRNVSHLEFAYTSHDGFINISVVSILRSDSVRHARLRP